MSGYKSVMVKGKRQLLHRVLWMQRFGDIPSGMELHHINGDTSDNRLANLMMVTRQDHFRYHSPNFMMTPSGWVKACPLCGKKYPVDSYRKMSARRGRKTGGVQTYCGPCHAQYERTRYQKKGGDIICRKA
jgi:hypothetical protein